MIDARQVDLTTHGITMFKHFIQNIAKLKVHPVTPDPARRMLVSVI
jgi:hypothetical protein